MLKVLAIGHSIVKDAGDGGETSLVDPRPCPLSAHALHVPESGWNFQRFLGCPRCGDESPGIVGGPWWVVRSGDWPQCGLNCRIQYDVPVLRGGLSLQLHDGHDWIPSDRFRDQGKGEKCK